MDNRTPALLLLALAALAAGCAPRPSPDGKPKRQAVVPLAEFSGPFFEWERLPSGGFNWRALYPFVEEDAQPGKRVFAFRPLFSQEDEGPGSTRWHFRALWPFVLVERTDASGRLRIFPVIWWRNRVATDGLESVRDMDWAVMPVLWGGADSKEGRYFAVFPVGGMIKGIFGKKYIRFVLFPLWVETQDPRYHSWNVVWPVFGYWRGPDQRGWRVWPLVGTDERERRFKRQFLLWPIFHHWKLHAIGQAGEEEEPYDGAAVWRTVLNVDTKWNGEVWTVFPLWLYADGPRSGYVSVLWPFFGRFKSYSKQYVEWHAPWPFFSWTGGKGIRGLKIWPFYMYRDAPDVEKRFILWPLYVRESLAEPTERNTVVRSAFIFQYVHKEWFETEIDGKKRRQAPPPSALQERLAAERAEQPPDVTGRKERPIPAGQLRSTTNTLLWPLWRYKRSELGERYFTALEPWFFRGSEVFDRHYGPFVTLYRYQRFADGASDHRALFNLFELYGAPAERRLRLTPLVDYRRVGEAAQVRRFRLLGGLFGYERRGTSRRLRLLWIPIGRKPADWDGPIQ